MRYTHDTVYYKEGRVKAGYYGHWKKSHEITPDAQLYLQDEMGK